MKNIVTITVFLMVFCGFVGCTKTDDAPMKGFIVCQAKTIRDSQKLIVSFVDVPAHRVYANQSNGLCWEVRTPKYTGYLEIYGPKTKKVTVRWVEGNKIGDAITVDCSNRLCKLMVAGPEDLPVVRTF